MIVQNLDIFSALAKWIIHQHTSYLCTVIETWGSSPRPIGSLMAVNTNGECVGSLSGGCVEQELLEFLITHRVDAPFLVAYGETQEQAERLQLPCGGRLRVLVEPIDKAHIQHINEIILALTQFKPITRQLSFQDHRYSSSYQKQAFIFEEEGNIPFRLTHTIGVTKQLFIIGASDVAKAVAELAQWMDYQVIVCDPRESVLQQWPIKGCILLAMMPDDALEAYMTNAQLVVVALTHDPRIDDMGLLAAFQSQAAYIGAMGSLRTSQKRRERLSSLGVSNEQLARLHAPIGLNIGSKTPREIAIAIMAELIQA